MGRIRQLPAGEDWLLPQRCVLGRSRVCVVRLGEPDVSGEHASLRWVGGAWELQDLYSRNGTFVDARRLAPGERAVLTAGTTIGLGRPGTLAMIDAAAPEAFAAPLGGGTPVLAIGGLLALPDPAAPRLMIFRASDGWMVERAGEGVPVADGEIVRSGADAWQLHLPEQLPQTQDSGSAAPDIDGIELRFHVSRDEEYVELIAVAGTRTIDLKARSHHYTLLMLARARMRDLAAASESQGWVQQSDLLEMLRIDASRLHLDIYRLRRQFGEAGILGAARIVERRQGTRALRIGVARIEVLPFDRNERGPRGELRRDSEA